jgi:hypothetical protein
LSERSSPSELKWAWTAEVMVFEHLTAQAYGITLFS